MTRINPLMFALFLAIAACGEPDADGNLDDSGTTAATSNTEGAAGGNSISGTVGDTTLAIEDGVALAKIVEEGGTTYLAITIGEGTAECPNIIHPGDSNYLAIGLIRTDGGTYAEGTYTSDGGTYTSDDGTVTLGALTDSYGETCADLGGLQLGGGPSSLTLTEVDDTIAGTFSFTMFHGTLANVGVVTGSFVAPLCEDIWSSCEF